MVGINRNKKMIKFSEFLQRIVPKIGAKAAFDIGRDSKINAIKKLLISKGITSKEEIEKFMDEELDIMANGIATMPPLPIK
jgi:hypothetical protein